VIIVNSCLKVAWVAIECNALKVGKLPPLREKGRGRIAQRHNPFAGKGNGQSEPMNALKRRIFSGRYETEMQLFVVIMTI
jgi:hypothetical protein